MSPLEILYWIGQNILGQPPILLGLVALIGLLIQRKSFEEIITSTFKVMIGVVMMIAGATLFVNELVNFQNIVGTAVGFQPKYPPGYIPLGDFTAKFGSYAAMIMTVAFIIHLIICLLYTSPSPRDRT